MATLDPHESGDVSTRHRRPNLSGCGGQLDIAVRVRKGLHGPDQVQGALKGGAPGAARVHPNREERAGEPPLAHPRDVDMPDADPRAEMGLTAEHALRPAHLAAPDDELLKE